MPRLGDLLDVDHERRFDKIGLHLYDQIGAACQDTSNARSAGEQIDGGLQRFRRFILHTLHRTPRPVVLG